MNQNKVQPYSGPVPLVEALPTIFASIVMQKRLRQRYGRQFASVERMMRGKFFKGWLGDDLHDFLLGETVNARAVWYAAAESDDPADPFPVTACRVGRAYIVRAQEYDDAKYFHSLAEAKAYAASEWELRQPTAPATGD